MSRVTASSFETILTDDEWEALRTALSGRNLEMDPLKVRLHRFNYEITLDRAEWKTIRQFLQSLDPAPPQAVRRIVQSVTSEIQEIRDRRGNL